MTTIYYSAYANDSGRRCELVLDASFDPDHMDCLEEFAAECAKDFHDNYDGWKAHWPRVFTLYDRKDGPPLAFMEVDRESTSRFIASLVD